MASRVRLAAPSSPAALEGSSSLFCKESSRGRNPVYCLWGKEAVTAERTPRLPAKS